MARFTPLTKNFWHLGCGNYSGIKGSDHDVVGTSIMDLHFLVPGNALIQLEESVPQLPHCSCCELVQISHSPSSVLAADDDSLGTRKCQVVTDKDSRAGNKASWEGFVMAVSDTNNPGVIRDRSPWHRDVDYSKIARAVMSEAVR